jgi:Tfp pilus assembly protein PilW
MKCNLKTIIGRRPNPTFGFTLPETLVGVAVGSLVLMSVMLIFMTSNRSFVAMGNYVSLDQTSRLAVEQMTRDIRNSQNLTSFSTNQLVFAYSGSANLVYSYNPSAATLTSWKTGGTTNTLLTGCDWLQFSMFNNAPQPGATMTNATTVGQAKAVSVAWRCSRAILGAKANTENMQEAMIVIRNKPVQ